MDKNEILRKTKEARSLFHEAQTLNQKDKLEEALRIALEIRQTLDESGQSLSKEINGYEHLNGGLNALIFSCMNLLNQYENMIPYLEKTLKYLDNDQNPNLWRLLGLLYLAKENNLEKACDAWRKALDLDPTLLDRYPGLSIVHTYDAMRKNGKTIAWKTTHINLETGDFSISLLAFTPKQND
jgi:tetratricopeptide (TPR) repeat protein